MAALERGWRQIVNTCITTDKDSDRGRHPERAITTIDFSWRYLQVLGCFDSPGFSFARKTIKVANISSGRFCVTWRSHPNKGISYLTHVCYGNNVSIYHELVFFLSGISSFNHSLLLVFICGYKAPSYVLCISWVGGKWMIIIRCLSSSKSLSLLSDQRLQKIPNQHHQHPILSFANATNVIFINLTGIYSTLTC